MDAFLAAEVKVVHACLEEPEFLKILEFLNVVNLSFDWYAGCIQSSGWLKGLPENLYVELLCFISENWNHGLSRHLQNTPFLKLVNISADTAVLNNSASNTAFACVPKEEASIRIYFSSQQSHITWLTAWSGGLQNAAQHHFMPESTHKAIMDLDSNKGEKLRQWLEQCAKSTRLSIRSFAKQLQEVVKASTNSKLVINAAHFFHFSSVSRYIDERDLFDLCSTIPVVDELGIIRQRRFVNILLPASISNWAKLTENNQCTYSWSRQIFFALSEDYLVVPPCARGLPGAGKDLVSFIEKQFGALDIPQLMPLNVNIIFGPLEWYQYQYKLSTNWSQLHSFKQNVSLGKWVKTSRGFESPTKSFWFDSNRSYASQLKEDDVPCIDEAFYGSAIYGYKDALKLVGVVTEVGQRCDVIVDHHIQMHKDFRTIDRLYKYLHASKWKPHATMMLPIWIPDELKWMLATSCVIHDVDGLFKSRLKVLEGCYDEDLLNFFSNSLGVPSHPRIEDYCMLWRDQTENDHHGISES